MDDSSKLPDEDRLDEFAKCWNMPYRLSLWPLYVVVIGFPIIVSLLLQRYKIHIFLVVLFVVIIIAVEYYVVMNFLRKQKKKK
jgi:hypothetical protein